MGKYWVYAVPFLLLFGVVFIGFLFVLISDLGEGDTGQIFVSGEFPRDEFWPKQRGNGKAAESGDLVISDLEQGLVAVALREADAEKQAAKNPESSVRSTPVSPKVVSPKPAKPESKLKLKPKIQPPPPVVMAAPPAAPVVAVAAMGVPSQVVVLRAARRKFGGQWGPYGIEEAVKSADEDWSRIGVKKDAASYPVNMERVIPRGKHIYAVVRDGIDTSLPGEVIAHAARHVVGGHGNLILIPAGSRIIGYYDSLEKVGDVRLGVNWDRIITPAGVSILFAKDAQSADQMGYAGLNGEIDNRYFEKYGVALLFSGLNTLLAGVLVNNSNGNLNADTASILALNAGEITREIINQNINIKPRLLVPPGAKVLIRPTRDIWFPRPKQQRVVAYGVGT